jgi:hypothetical protein
MFHDDQKGRCERSVWRWMLSLMEPVDKPCEPHWTMCHDRGAWGHFEFHVGAVGSVGNMRPPDAACPLPAISRKGRRLVSTNPKVHCPRQATGSAWAALLIPWGMSPSTVEVSP